MIALTRLLLALLLAPFRAKLALVAENAALRQQILVLRRKLRGQAQLSNGDRLFFLWLYPLVPAFSRAVLIVRPDTLVRRHRAGFRCYWRWKSRGRIGWPRVDQELRALVRRMKEAELRELAQAACRLGDANSDEDQANLSRNAAANGRYYRSFDHRSR